MPLSRVAGFSSMAEKICSAFWSSPFSDEGETVFPANVPGSEPVGVQANRFGVCGERLRQLIQRLIRSGHFDIGSGVVWRDSDDFLVLRDCFGGASVPAQEARVTAKRGPIVGIAVQIGTIKGVSLADMPEIIRIVDLDEQALAVRGARGERERLFVLLFSLDAARLRCS